MMNDKPNVELSAEQWAERYRDLGDRLRHRFNEIIAEAYQRGYEEGFAVGAAPTKRDARTSN